MSTLKQPSFQKKQKKTPLCLHYSYYYFNLKSTPTWRTLWHASVRTALILSVLPLFHQQCFLCFQLLLFLQRHRSSKDPHTHPPIHAFRYLMSPPTPIQTHSHPFCSLDSVYSDPNIGRICIFGLYSDPNIGRIWPKNFGSEYRPNIIFAF